MRNSRMIRPGAISRSAIWFNAKKDLDDALTNYRTAQTLESELVRRDPRTLELQSDLLVTC
jgi:hypothetical protein